MPETEAAQDALIRLKARLRSEYPHQNLAALYAKTTVSELKKAGMAEAAEEAYHLFEEEEVIPYLPPLRQKRRPDGRRGERKRLP